VSEVFLQLPFPFALRQRFILPWSLALLECSLPLGLPSCRLAFDFPRFLVPSTVSVLQLAPYEVG
jgi:hypothetical protein